MERTFDVNFLLKDADPAAGLLLALCAGVYAKNQRAFPRRTASLLTTITNGIPVGDAPQVQLIHAPPHACRHFRKLLAYDIRHSALFAIALLPDAGPTSVALHVTSVLAKNMTKAKKQYNYTRSQMQGSGDLMSQCLHFPRNAPADAQRYSHHSVILKPIGQALAQDGIPSCIQCSRSILKRGCFSSNMALAAA